MKILKMFVLSLVLIGGGGMWAQAHHQARNPKTGLTHVEGFTCNDGSIIIKKDYDLDANGKDDYTTYTKKGEEFPFAELIGKDGYFKKGIVHGEEFGSFNRLRSKYPTVCEALRQRKG